MRRFAAVLGFLLLFTGAFVCVVLGAWRVVDVVRGPLPVVDLPARGPELLDLLAVGLLCAGVLVCGGLAIWLMVFEVIPDER